MEKNKLNTLLRAYAKAALSPKDHEKNNIQNIYSAFCTLFKNECYQVGSYARFTSISPVNDLDILFIAGDATDKKTINPSEALKAVHNSIEKYLVAPEGMSFKVTGLQTHSIGVLFYEKSTSKEILSVDVVPGFKTGIKTTDFGKETDIYWVPEVLMKRKKSRSAYYADLVKNPKKEEELWIKSDPRGYIKLATDLNKNPDFRKSVKIIKKWIQNCKDISGSIEFKIKSFHAEQLIVKIITENPTFEIYDLLFHFFVELPVFMKKAIIPDRADSSKCIDAYIETLTNDEIRIIEYARDGILIKFEEIETNCIIDDLLVCHFYKRHSAEESFLFDRKIMTLIQDDCVSFGIQGTRTDNHEIITNNSLLPRHISIDFKITRQLINVNYLWKVKNSNQCPDPRGKIVNYNERRENEGTEYIGDHFVECFATKGDICIGKDRRYVKIR